LDKEFKLTLRICWIRHRRFIVHRWYCYTYIKCTCKSRIWAWG